MGNYTHPKLPKVLYILHTRSHSGAWIGRGKDTISPQGFGTDAILECP